jgi:hypothetical protein
MTLRAKVLEVRDAMTLVPVLAIWLAPTDEAERWLLARAGYGEQPSVQRTYFVVLDLDGGVGRYETSPTEWQLRNNRTMQVAHQYIQDHWADLSSGDVVDVEYILGIAKEPKESDRTKEVPDGLGA